MESKLPAENEPVTLVFWDRGVYITTPAVVIRPVLPPMQARARLLSLSLGPDVLILHPHHEGTRWIRGHHKENSEAARALLAASALVR